MSTNSRKGSARRAFVDGFPAHLTVFMIVLAAAGGLAVWATLATLEPFAAVRSAPTADVIAALGSADSAKYLQVAADLRQMSLAPENRWILALWPPGMPLALMALEVLPGPIVVKAALLAVAAWSVSGAIVAALVAARGQRAVAWLFAASWATAPMAVLWVYGRGLMHSDGLGVSVLALALASLFVLEERARRGVTGRRLLTSGAVTGALLGLTLYLRWALIVSVLGVVVLALGLLVVGAIRRRHRTRGPVPSILSPTGPLAALVIAFFLVTVPWGVIRATVVAPGSLAWSSGDFEWRLRWLADDDLRNVTGQWRVESDANWACDLDADRCRELRPVALAGDPGDDALLRAEALRAAAAHPVGFIRSRIVILRSTWFAGAEGSTRPTAGTPYTVAFGWLLVSAFVIGVVLAVQRRTSAPLFVTALTIVVVGQVAVLSVSHIVPRYWMPLATVLLVGTALLSTVPSASRPPRRDGGIDPGDFTGT